MTSSQQQGLPQTREELNAQIDQLWREELEWVRQHPNPDLTEFNELIEKETRKSTVNKLPPLDIAMWPQDVFCDIDVSNPEKFNDRFIELPTDTRATGFEKFFWGFHNGMALFLLAALLFGDDDPIEVAFMFGLLVLIFWPLIYVCTFVIGAKKSGGIRYNRQAQLIHIDDGDGRVTHIPWQHVCPLIDIGVAPSSILRLCGPRAHAKTEANRLGVLSGLYHKASADLLDTQGIRVTLSDLDHSSTHRNLQRLEFMRRYMECGLKAIQPHPEAIELGLVKDPEQFDDPTRIRSASWDGKYLLYPIDRAWHYLSFGPWLDRRARLSTEGFEWNDEVKNLCGPNPDLRGLNTRPVKSRTDVYYRPDGASYRLVDRWGNPLRFGA